MLKYLLIINNSIIMEKGYPVFKVYEKGKEFYATAKTRENINKVVKKKFADIRQEEANIPEAAPFLDKEPHYFANKDFRLLIVRTPWYQFQQELAKTDGAARVIGSPISYIDYWLDNRAKIFADEFFKYSILFPTIEEQVNRSIGGNRALRIKYGGNKMFNLLYTQVSGLFNPLDVVPGLEGTKLFSKLRSEDVDPNVITALDEPFVFKSYIKSDTIPIYLTTTADFLSMCGINGMVSLNSSDIYKIIAGICYKRMFPVANQAMLNLSFTKLPTGIRIYQVVSDSTGAPVKAFIGREKPAYDFALTDPDYTVVELSAHAVLAREIISRADVRTISVSDFTEQLGGAQFV